MSQKNGIKGTYKGIGIYKKENEKGFCFENGVKIDGKLLDLLEQYSERGRQGMELGQFIYRIFSVLFFREKNQKNLLLINFIA